MTSHDPDLVERFSESLKAKNRQPATVESYCRDAQDFLRFLEKSHLTIDKVEPETLLWFRDHLRDAGGERENSVRRKVIGVRQFFRFLADDRKILSSPFDMMPIPERDDSLDEGLGESRFQSLVALVSEPGIKNRRDRAILYLLAYEGLKASEIIDLQWRELIQSKRIHTLSVPGLKGRTIQLQEETSQALTDYQESFQAWLRHQSPEARERYPWMFVAFKGKELPLVLPRMTRHGLKFMLHELGNKLGFKHLHTETLRHHAMCYQLAIGRGPEDVMQHLGLRRLGNIGKHLAQYRNQP